LKTVKYRVTYIQNNCVFQVHEFDTEEEVDEFLLTNNVTIDLPRHMILGECPKTTIEVAKTQITYHTKD
jgi:hypothetical protein